ncbi:MAG: DNRLRE domain-containing protein, partial [Saprospiraceae bacterium]
MSTYQHKILAQATTFLFFSIISFGGSFAKKILDNWKLSTFQLLLILIASLGIVESASAQVTAGTSTYGTFNNSSSATISYTNASGSNKLLVVGVSAQQPGQSVNSVTYNGLALTKLGKFSNSNQSRIEIWYLKAPPVGTYNVVVSNSASENGVIGVMSFSGVNQTSPFRTLVTAQGSSTTATVTAASAVGELVYSVVGFNNASTNLLPGSGQTEYWDQTMNSSIAGSGSTKAGAASVAMQWTSSSASWTIGAVSIVPTTTSTLGSISSMVSASSDDAEENLSGGAVSLTSNDIELVQDGSSNQQSGMRFNNITIPKGATITSAYVQFTAKATNTGAVTLTLSGQAIDNAPTFTSSSGNISSRTKTAATVSWSPADWNIIGQTYQTSNIASIIQEIVNRSGWASGNSMVIMATGPTTATRTAQSYDGVPASAPVLVINFSTQPVEICNNAIDDDGDGLIDCADSDCTFLTNNEFDNGFTGWSLYLESGNTATRSVDNTNKLSGVNSAYMNISQASGTDWHIQFTQEGKSIVAGKTYNVTFQAKAAATRSITVMLQGDQSPWDTYWYQPLTLTTTGQTYSFYFQANSTNVGHVGLYFNLGESTANVWLDNISFSEVCAVPEICNNSVDDDGDGFIDCADSDCSFLDNTEFDLGLSTWELYIQSGNTATYSVDNTSKLSGVNSVYTNITQTTGTDWHVQLAQQGLSIVVGKTYNVSFQAKATANRNISAMLQLDQSPYDNYWFQTVALTTTAQTFSYNFQVNTTNTGHIGLIFNLGESMAGVWLDQISFKEICTPAEICDNSIDDDGDGLIDAADPDCKAYLPGGVAGAAMWLKADAGISTGSTMTWADYSGNNRNGVQSTATNKPLVSSSVFNFNPALTFDGTDDYLAIQNLTGLPTGASQVEMFAVANHTNTPAASWANILTYGTGNTSQMFGLGRQASTDNGATVTWGNDAISTVGEFAGNKVALLDGKYTGTQVVLSSFGVQRVTQTSTNNRTIAGGNIGAYPAIANGPLWIGNIPEIIVFPTNLTTTQVNQVNSYLAIKYGITLDQTSPLNYIASNGTTIFWNGTTNSGHKNNIAGIARDDLSSLNQKQSKSSNAGLQVVIGNGGTIATDNASNLQDFLIDKSALVWGDNAGSVAAWTATGAPLGSQIVTRTWKVQETGVVGTVRIRVADNSGTNGLPNEGTNPVFLLVDADGNFAAGATSIPMTLNGTNWEANVDFTNGQYFTFGMGCSFSLASTQVDVTPCFGATNGAINLSPSGGIAPYTFNWSDIGSAGNLQNRTGLVAGDYNVTVSDAASCAAVANFTLTQPTAINISGAVNNAVPAGSSNGAIDLTVTNGTSPYAYAWSASSGGVVPSGQANIQDLTGIVAGIYKVTVTDAGSCTATATYTVKNSVTKQLYLTDPSQALDRVDPVATADGTTANSATIAGVSVGTPTTVTLSAAADTDIDQASPTKNWGGCTGIYLNGSSSALDHPMIKFDLSGIPAGATITSATMTLVKIGGGATGGTGNSSTAVNVSAHQITNAWTEGTSSCYGSTTVANWTQRQSGTNWTTAGGDYNATAENTISVAGDGAYSWNIPNMVQSWVNNPSNNQGVLLKMETEPTAFYKVFASRENSTVDNRPVLTITYTAGAVTQSFTATDDAMLYSTNPTTNYGGDINFQVGAFSAGSQYLKSVLKFDVSGLAGQTVSSAILKVEVRSSYNVPVPIEVHRLTKDWTESTVSWASPWTSAGGDYSSTIEGSTSFTSAISLGEPTQTMSIDISSLVNGWVTGTYPNYGLVLLDPGNLARSLNFYSSEGSVKPTLQVITLPPSADPISTTFTQSPAMCTPLQMPAGGTVSVTNYIAVSSGSLPASPNITATLKYGSTTFMTLTNPTYNSGTGLLTWSKSLDSDVTVPAGEAISLTVTTYEPNVKIAIQYDSQTKPSKISLPVSTYIDIVSYAVCDAPYPGGNIITNTVGGTHVYPRAVVTDPFGYSDINGMNITITPTGSTIAATSVATAGCTRTYEYNWITPFSSGTFTLPATAKEGFENTVTDTQPLSFDLCTPTIGTPVFALGATSSRCQGAGSATYSATSTNTTGITYTLDAASLAAGNTISPVTGTVTYAPGWGGNTTITATASGCGGPKTATHVVTTTPTVTTPIFVLGTNSTRCQGTGTVTYTASATNATSLTYSLDATSLSAGNTINASTGAVTFTAGWTGTSTITASAAGCGGPKTATHTVTHTLSVTAPVFALGASSTRCQAGGSVTYSASASNTTGITYSLDAASIAAGNIINASTGVVSYAAGWNGTSTITATANGCNGPKTAAHTITTLPNGSITFALGATSTRAAGNGNVTYSASANNGGTITYSLDATSLAAGLTINSNSGMVNYLPSWTGASTITASVTGCGGTQTATHIASTTNVYKQLYLSDPSQALDRVHPGLVSPVDNTTASSNLLLNPNFQYDFENNTNDNTGSNNGTAYNGPTYSTGQIGQAINLDGVNDYVALPSGILNSYNDITIACWVKWDDNTSNDWERIFDFGDNTTRYMYLTPSSSSNTMRFAITTSSSGGEQYIQTTALTTGQWTHVAITLNGNTGTIYVNGVAASTGTISIDPSSITPTLNYIGRSQWSADPYFDGKIDDFRIYGSALSASQISSLANGSSSPNVATFTQNPALCSPLTIKTGQPITITNYISNVSGSMPANPNITAELKYGGSNIITFTSPTYSGGLLTWTGTIPSDVTVPAGQAITLEITNNQPSVSFKIDYDSQTKPSKIELPVSTFIDINSYAVYNAPYPGGSIILSTTTGTTVYPRAVVTDPFGFSDITAMNITITPSGSTVAANSVATGGCTRTYEYAWNTTSLGGTYALTATAKEGFENAVSDLQALNFDICSPAIGSPAFALGATSTRCQGAGTVTYTATSTNSTGMTYSLDAASLTYGNTINPATGAVTYLAGWNGTTVITATATGCGGPKTATHTVNLNPNVGTPVFTLGASSYRCQAAGTVTYTASATNSTGITYSLDAASISGGNTINASTGVVTYAAGWFGTTIITASAAGCNGPAIATHTVAVANAVGTPVFDLGASSVRCGGGAFFYTATAQYSTGITYSLDAASLAAGNTINAATGQVNFTASWKSASTITATATGCGGSKTATHTVTISSACPPIALDDAANGQGGSPLFINVLANDSDVNNNINPSSISIVTLPVNGSAVLSNGQVVYLPNGTYEGVDVFTYRVCDFTSPTPLCDTATVIVTIDPTTVDACSEAVRGQIYYLPFPEQDVRTALIASTVSWALPIPSNNIRTVISVKIPYPGMTLIWDHWEDGFEADPNTPTQTTTQIWGDGNPYNGIAPGYPDDILPSGAAIVLDNTMPSAPRVASNIFYDGKDKIVSSGAITVTQVSGEPSIIGKQGMKTNVTPVANFGKSFTIPVGQNFNSQDFAYTALFIRASENNTTINIDKDNNGTFETTTTLNEGQSYFLNGGVLSGATVTGSAPIGVDVHYGGIDGYSSREIPIFPATWYSDTYYTPVPTTASPDSAVVMLYNSLNRSLDINWNFGTSSSGTVTVPAKKAIRFPLNLSSTNAYKFTNPTGEAFTAIEIIDSYTPGGGGNLGPDFDWAFNLISENRLTNFAAIAWAPGGTDATVNGNPIWVTPTANTTIYVKYDGDVLNGGSTSPCGMHYDVSYSVNKLSYKKLFDSDNDQSGLAVFTCDGTDIAAVYGEDPSVAGAAFPYWDVGSTIQPFCGDKLILANDDRAYTLTNQPVTVAVLKNDWGFLATIDPATLATLGYRQPSNGSVTVNSNGTILYTPNLGFVGTDTLEYGICSTPGSPPNVVCDRAFVIIVVNSCPSPSQRNLISGKVFLDKNKDGVNNDGGTGFTPGKVYLYVDGNCNSTINTGELADSVSVDSSGTYQFILYPEKIVSDNFDGTGGASTCASGSDGTAAWATNWVDAGEGGSTGYCVSPAQSAANTDAEIVQDGAFGYALRLDDNNVSATRTLNLSGATYAFLSFSYRRASTSLTSGEDIYVQVSTNGSSFTTIYTISGTGSTDAAYVTVYNQNISSFAATNTYIRFLTNNSVDEADYVFIDNVSIRYLKYPQCYITKIEPSLIPADYSLTTAGQHAMTANNAATCLAPYDFGIAKGSTSISGTLYNDPNGLSDGQVNGTPFGNPSGATVYAYLVDVTGEVRFKTTVNSANGTFTFPQADINSTFTLMVSASNLTLFTPAPTAASFPAGWASAGENYGTNNGAGTGNEAGIPNSIITVKTGNIALTGVKIGIQQVNAGPDRVICFGGTATMGAVTSPGTWTAKAGNPGTATITSPTSPTSTITNFSQPGMYYFYWSNNGISDSASVRVDSLPLANAGPDQAICFGVSANLTASGGTNYNWNNGLGAGASKTVMPASTTTYTVTVTNAAGCTATDEVIVTVNPLPVANAGADLGVCAGASANLTATGGVSYDWDNGLGAGASKSVTPASTTTYTVTVTAANGCTATDQVVVTVNALPAANAGADVSICTNASTTLFASGGTSYTWDNGLGAGASKSVTPANTTTYTVTVTGANGCTATDQVVVTVAPCPEVCNNGLDDDGDGLTDCADPDCGAPAITNVSHNNPTNCPLLNNGQITVTATGTSLEYSIDGGVSYQTSNVFTGLSAGSYYIRIRNSTSGCLIDYTGNPVVINNPVCIEICTNGIDDDGDGLIDCADSDCAPDAYAGSDVNICFSFSHTLSASATGGAMPYTYNWDNGLGIGQSHTVSPLVTTIYHVTITSASGCSSMDSVIVTVTVCPEDCTNGIDDDGDGLIDCDDPDCQAVGQPQLMWDSYNTCPGVVLQEQVIFNDANLQNAAYSISSVPSHGTVSINNNGVFVYTPTSNSCSDDKFVYQVCNQATGCCDTASVFLTFGDGAPPTLANVPADITISCDDAVPAAPLVYGIDGCPGIFISFDEDYDDISSGSCQSYTITRTWTATDMCGNTGSATQTITVQDVVAPEIFRVYTLSNGKRLAAGVSQKTTNQWKYVQFPINFNEKPLVFSQVISDNEPSAVTVRVRNVSVEGFELMLREQESSNGVHSEEQVAWMALEPGALADSSRLQSFLVTNVTNSAKTITFAPAYTGLAPVFMASVQTTKDADPLTVRYSSLTTGSVQVNLQEEISKDAETVHANEDLAYLALKSGQMLTDEKGEIFGESGLVALTDNWVTVNLARKYNKPSVLFGGLLNGGDPATIRVRNVTANSFQVKIKEWDYLDGTHASTSTGYIVVEGSVPAVNGSFCDGTAPDLIPGYNLFATDNCDNQ